MPHMSCCSRSKASMTGLALCIFAIWSGCGRAPAFQVVARGPQLRVLGTAQDGGVPHAACTCSRCEAARRDPSRRRLISSVALILPRGDGCPLVYLIDASPDIRDQLAILRDVRNQPRGRVDRSPINGVLLTHAHIGHYLGLAFLGFEAVHTTDLPVYCSPRMAGFLRTNGPWSQLVGIGNIALHELEPGKALDLPWRFARRQGCVRVIPMTVPHRHEYSDTVALLFRATSVAASPTEQSRRTVLYVPDTEPWQSWNPSLLEVIAREGVDIALIDGTFFSADELPNRKVAAIGHPLMRHSMDLLEPLVRRDGLTVYFTHLNHSNPALRPDSAAFREVQRRGFHLAAEGQTIPLLND